MKKFILVCSMLLSLSCLADSKSGDTAKLFTGEWEGAGTQSDGGQWSIRVNSRPNGYFIDYPSLVCGGVWKLLKSTPFRLEIRETLIRD